MSIHLAAKPGDIAELVLMPGDPMRAKFISEKYLKDAVCHNQVRGMLGFTGTYKGKKISIQGSGMGIPSMTIYSTELAVEYNVKTIIRIGTCGAIQDNIKLRDIIIAQGASTDSNINSLRFKGMAFAPLANFDLLSKAVETAKNTGFTAHTGNILTSDTFYDDDPDFWKIWAKYGALAIEMETAALYTVAAKNKVKALAILTVSDHIVKKEKTSSEERETSFGKMVELALETIINY